MNIFEDEEEKGGKEVKAVGGKDKLPKTPDFTQWGVEPRKGSPFILDDFRGSNAYRKTNP